MFSNDLEAVSVAQVLAGNVERRPDREFIVRGDDRLTYAQLDQQVTALAAGLAGLGVSRGDRVALTLPNGPRFVVAFFALASLGAIMVPLNPGHRAPELEYVLGQTETGTLIVAAGHGHLAVVDELRPKLPALRQVVVAGEGQPPPGVTAWEELMAQGRGQKRPAVTIDPRADVCAILYASVTADGRPRGTTLTHDNLVWSAATAAKVLQCTAADVFLLTMPLFLIGGISLCLLSAVSGSKLVVMDAFDPEGALRAIEREKVTLQLGVPVMFIAELNHPHFARYDCSSLRVALVGGAPCPLDVIRHVCSDMGCDLAVIYGLTETAGTLTMTRLDDSHRLKAETVGRPLPGAEVKIVDEDGVEVPRRVVGELMCRGRGVTRGFYNMPQATTEAIDADGWLATGDLATMDEHDYVRILGLKKDMIARGNQKVYPREIEELLHGHPQVREVAVIGLPDETLGEAVCACLQLAAGESVTAGEIVAWCRERLADFKVPDRVVFVESFPMTEGGRIRKTELRESVMARQKVNQR